MTLRKLNLPRKILLLFMLGAWIFLEILVGVENYGDTSDFFPGLGAMFLTIFIIPPMLGLLYGAFEASGGASLKRLGGALIRMLAILIVRILPAAFIFVYTSHGRDDFLSVMTYIPIWTVGLGAVGFSVSYLVGLVIELITGAVRARRADKTE